MTTKAEQTRAERITDAIRQHADVVRGHDAVHPDRDTCGGVGGCALMRAEHDAETEIVGLLQRAARAEADLTVKPGRPT